MCCLKLWIKSPYLKNIYKNKEKNLKRFEAPIGEGRENEFYQSYYFVF